MPWAHIHHYRSLYGRKAEFKVSRLKILKQHLHRIAMIDNPTCDCGIDRETPDHIPYSTAKTAIHTCTESEYFEFMIQSWQIIKKEEKLQIVSLSDCHSHSQVYIDFQPNLTCNLLLNGVPNCFTPPPTHTHTYKAKAVLQTDSDFSCQTGQVRFRSYFSRLKFCCPQKYMCLAMSKY